MALQPVDRMEIYEEFLNRAHIEITATNAPQLRPNYQRFRQTCVAVLLMELHVELNENVHNLNQMRQFIEPERAIVAFRDREQFLRMNYRQQLQRACSANPDQLTDLYWEAERRRPALLETIKEIQEAIQGSG